MRFHGTRRQQAEVFFKRKPWHISGREMEQQGTQSSRALDDILKSLDLGYKQRGATDYLGGEKQHD